MCLVLQTVMINLFLFIRKCTRVIFTIECFWSCCTLVLANHIYFGSGLV